MKNYIILTLLFLTSIAQANFDKKAYYHSLYSKDVALVSAQLKVVQSHSEKDKEALEGALLMKKAELVPEKKEKLELFKAGKLKLEAAIAKDHKNCEYRFLRLIIQEHAPKFLGYDKNILDDVHFIKENINNVSDYFKRMLHEYSKTSTHLKF